MILRDHRGRSIFVAVLLVLTACAGSPGAGTQDAPTGTAAPPVTTPSTIVPPPTPVEIQSPATFPLSETGPWLVYGTDDGLTVANAGGSGRTPLFEGSAQTGDLSAFASPSGGLLAVYTFEDPEARAGPRLEILRLPHGSDVHATPLLSKEIQAALSETGGAVSPAVAAARAVTVEGSLAWSPDGQRLAFVAALDGPSSDLYTYDVARDQQRRITSGPNEVAGLSWSPDGRWIAYQAVQSFRSDGSLDVGSVWAVSPDGTIQNKLYAPEGDGEVFVGWSEGDSLLSYSLTASGPRDLRAAGAEGVVQNVVVAAGFRSAAYDPRSGTAALASDGAGADSLASGAYLWHPVVGLSRVDPGAWSAVEWSPAAGRFYFSGAQGALSVDPDGKGISSTDRVGRVLVSPDGLHVALWRGGESQAGEIAVLTPDLGGGHNLASGGFETVAWNPDSSGLMTVAEAGLVFYPLDGPPILVDSGAAGLTGVLGWVAP